MFGFTNFDFTSDPGCDTNYVEVYDGLDELPANLVSRYCGNDMPAVYNSRGPNLLIKMVTTANNTGSGFSAWFDLNYIGNLFGNKLRNLHSINSLDVTTGTAIATATRTALITSDRVIHLDYGYGHNVDE